MERFRPFLKDKTGKATKAGRQIHELVLLDTTIKSIEDPKVEYAVSDELMSQYQQRREELIEQVGLSQKSILRERRLIQLREALQREGMPHWRMLPEKNNNIGV